MNIRDLLALSQLLVESDSAALDTELLLAHCLQKNRTYLYTWPEQQVAADIENSFRELMARRQRGEPVAYLTGSRDFWSLPLAVDNCTLIPRPDTERLVEAALEIVKAEHARVLDLGTGTGAIALALASEHPQWAVLGVDRSSAAVALAQRNAHELKVGNSEFIESDWFTKIPAQQFELIVSNPPYIDVADPHLQRGDVRFEPRSALVAAQNGLAAIAEIIASAPAYLKMHGWLLFEHGFEQGPAVRELLAARGFESVTTWNDLSGHERVSGGCWPGNA